MGGVAWTPKEDKHLLENWPDDFAIANDLHRTVKAVRDRAQRLGLYEEWNRADLKSFRRVKKAIKRVLEMRVTRMAARTNV